MAKKKELERGRPTDFKPEYTQKLLSYFDRKPYEEDKKGKIVATDFPTLAGFAISIGVHRETLRNWCKIDQDFFAAYKMAAEYQENFLAINGNKGIINPQFAIFTAKNVLNWRDKKEVEVSGNVSELTDEQLDRLIAEKLEKK